MQLAWWNGWRINSNEMHKWKRLPKKKASKHKVIINTVITITIFIKIVIIAIFIIIIIIHPKAGSRNIVLLLEKPFLLILSCPKPAFSSWLFVRNHSFYATSVISYHNNRLYIISYYFVLYLNQAVARNQVFMPIS